MLSSGTEIRARVQRFVEEQMQATMVDSCSTMHSIPMLCGALMLPVCTHTHAHTHKHNPYTLILEYNLQPSQKYKFSQPTSEAYVPVLSNDFRNLSERLRLPNVCAPQWTGALLGATVVISLIGIIVFLLHRRRKARKYS